MTQEKVFIVLSHKHSLKKGTKDWETTEQVEFVNQLRNKHTSMSTAVADYINKQVLTGSRYGITDYNKFIEYVEKKYPKQLAELDKKYKEFQIRDVNTENSSIISDSFGNIRQKTVFDI